MPSLNHTVAENIPCVMRLDLYIAGTMGLFSRSQIKARELKAKVNGKEAKISCIVKKGDLLELDWNETGPVNIVPEDIPLDIIFENERVAVINKPQGMVVHPGAGNTHGTVANALYYRRLQKGICENANGLRPGVVHRLDKDTSGVMIAAYDDEALALLSSQFKSRKTKKIYYAIVSGIPEEKKGRIETFIARDPGNRKRFIAAAQGKIAVTLYTVVKTWQKYSLVKLMPKTGRTHQIRVHLRYLGHPVAGDPLYGYVDTRFPVPGLMLHAKSLAITLPDEDEERIFKTPLPQRFIKMIRFLNGKNA